MKGYFGFCWILVVLLLSICICLSEASKSFTKKLLLIGMQTRTNAFSLRQGLRETMLQLKYFKRGQIDFLFILASPPPEDVKTLKAIQSEIALYKDILFFEHIIDGWKQVGKKHDLFLKHGYPLGYKFLMKLDDDAAVDYHFLTQVLESFVDEGRHKEYLLMGRLAKYSKPSRDPTSKYYLSRKIYPEDYRVTFPVGYGSIATTTLIKMLFEKGYDQPCLFMEDANIGIRVQNYLNHKRHRDPGVELIDFPYYGVEYSKYKDGEIPKRTNRFFNLIHHVNEDQVICIYKADLEGKDDKDKYRCLDNHVK